MTKVETYTVITGKLSEAYADITSYGFCRRAHNRLVDALYLARQLPSDVPKNRALRAHIVTAIDVSARNLGIRHVTG